MSYFFKIAQQWGHYFKSPTWSSELCEGLTICRVKAVPSFLSHFKTLSVGPDSGIEPATSCSAVKPSTNLANPTAVTEKFSLKSSCSVMFDYRTNQTTIKQLVLVDFDF